MRINSSVSADGATGILAIEGDFFSVEDSQKLVDQVNSFVERGIKNIVLDMSGTRTLNSMGVGSLVRAFTAVRRLNGKVALAGASKKFSDVMQITRLQSIFPSYATVADAVAELSMGSGVEKPSAGV
jgi:anti-sigma B factor antagonist